MIDLNSVLELLNSQLSFVGVLGFSFIALLWQNWYFKRLKARQEVANLRFRAQLSQLLLILLVLLLVLATLPIDESLRAQLFSLFGLLISAMIALSSTTLVGNLMAGLMLRNMNSFGVGDFIRVKQTYGRVSEIGLLHVEIQDENRALVCLPNMLLIADSFQVTLRSGAVIHCEVSLGYDVSHSLVEPLLFEAAEQAGFSDAAVLIKELGDYSVLYRVVAKLEDVKQVLTAPSRLRARVLDVLHEQGIEIASPTLMNSRVFDRRDQYLPDNFYSLKDEQAFSDTVLESLAFDVAEVADNLVRIKQLLQSNKDKIAEVEKALEVSKNEAEQQQLNAQLVRLDIHKQRLQSVLDKLKQQQEQQA